ncbi:MAG: hypothetical protein ABS81_11040 [Pseudonocardia sp. SCN 72-86]|nr:MAG: hypothetical protein ABS81_11040 [Pseudonocardia sp. SCN 72-86]
MSVADDDLRLVRVENLRVGLNEFGAVWAAAEERASARAAAGETDWFAGGVLLTCRWIAGACVEYRGRRRLPVAPITRRSAPAIEELIEAEYVAAVILASNPVSPLVVDRPGFLDAVVATLSWAWRRAGPPPLPLQSGATSSDQV